MPKKDVILQAYSVFFALHKTRYIDVKPKEMKVDLM